MDKMGLNFKRFGTLFVVVSITFPILVTFTLIHQNSVFDLVKGFSKINVFARRAQKNATTTTVLKQGAQNITVKAGGGIDQNITESALDKVFGHKDPNGMPGIFQERAQTQTISDIGPKNHQKNAPFLSTMSVANDQFLDGLLVSTLDEASCLGRYESHLYRKASLYKPSAYLISKLRKYEHLHRSCGPHTKSYNKITRKGAKFSKNDAGTKCKYLVWTTSNGLGNKMLTLAAAFLYAILTDCVLLVRFGADMFSLFCEPFPDSSWLLPRNFPYWTDQKHIETYERMLMNSKKNSSKEFLPQFLILNLQHTHDGQLFSL